MEKKQAERFSIDVDDDLIFITQDNDYDEPKDVIRIHPDQVDLLVKWLLIAKSDLAGKK